MINLLVFIIFLLVLPSCIEQKLPADIQKIIDKGTLVVAVYEQDMHPFFMNNKKGELEGVDIDLAKSIAKDLGVKAVFVRDSKTFDNLIQKVAIGEADIGVSKISYTSKRAKKIIYSKPYVTTHVSFLCSRTYLKQLNDEKKYNNIKDVLKDNKEPIHVYSGSSYVDIAKKLFPFTPIEEHLTDEDLMRHIETGKGLCAIRDEFAVKGYLAKFPENNPHTFELVLSDKEDPFYVVIKPNAPNLAHRVNKIIDKTKSSRDVNSLLERQKEFIKESRKQ